MIPNFGKKDKEQYFKRLFEDYYAPFCIYAKRFVDSRQTCEDIVSEAFIIVWEKVERDQLQRETAVEYIRRIVTNLCLNHLKHHAFELDYAVAGRHKAPLYADSPHALYTQKELYEMLTDLLGQLPEQHREVFIASYIDEKNNIEIAKELDISVKSVVRYKQKAIELLKKNLKNYLSFMLLLMAVKHYG